MNNFKRNSCLVGGGHMINTPSGFRYAIIDSWKSLRNALTIEALKNLEVKDGNIQNAYLTSLCVKKIWTTCGPESESNKEKKAIMVQVKTSWRILAFTHVEQTQMLGTRQR